MKQESITDLKVIEWFEKFEEPYRTQALKNIHPMAKDEPAPSPSVALSFGFIWSRTRQGQDYWSDFHKKLQSNDTTD